MSQDIDSMVRYVSPVNPSVYPHLAITLLCIGLFFMAWFFVYPIVCVGGWFSCVLCVWAGGLVVYCVFSVCGVVRTFLYPVYPHPHTHTHTPLHTLHTHSPLTHTHTATVSSLTLPLDMKWLVLSSPATSPRSSSSHCGPHCSWGLEASSCCSGWEYSSDK